jgi:Flp pilus assembly pilin Flp
MVILRGATSRPEIDQAGGVPAPPRHRLAADRRAVTALEYGIIATFLCLALLGIFTRFGSVLTTMFSGVTTSI